MITEENRYDFFTGSLICSVWNIIRSIFDFYIIL